MNEFDKPLTYDEFTKLAADAARSGRTVFDEYQTRTMHSKPAVRRSVEAQPTELGRALAGGHAGHRNIERDETLNKDNNASDLTRKFAQRRIEKAHQARQARQAQRGSV